MHDAPLRPSAALIAYAEPFIAGRRVLVFGDATSPIAEQLLDRGARLVHMYDPDPARVAEAATRNTESRVSLAPLSEGGLASREGAFDCAIVEDLSSLPNRASALRALRRALSPRGIALIAAPNPDADKRLIAGGKSGGDLDYYGLYDAVAAELDHVRMLGQTPFVGYAIVDFAPDGTPEPSFDSSFVPGGAEEPEQYIALGSAQEARLDDMAIVQLPLSSVSLGSGDDQALRAARAAERRAQKRIASLEAELRRARESDNDVERLQNELDRRDSWIRELENRAATADARADDAETELETLRERLQALTERLAQAESAARSAAPAVSPAERSEDARLVSTLREELDDVRRVAARNQREREWAEERVQKLEGELDEARRQLEESARASRDAAPRARLAELEAELQDRRAELARASDERAALEQKLTTTTEELAKAQKDLAAAREELEELRKTTRDRDERVAKLTARLDAAESEKKAAVARAYDDLRTETQKDLQRLEEQLAERGRRVAELEEQQRRLERHGRTLVAELNELRKSVPQEDPAESAELRRQLAELAELHAAREADLVAAEWVIAELREKLASGAPALVQVRSADSTNGAA